MKPNGSQTLSSDSAGTASPIAAVERVLQHDAVSALCRQHGRGRVKRAVQALQAEARQQRPLPAWAADPGAYAAPLLEALHGLGYQPVYNLSGTLIHTNLGRAPLSPALWAQVEPLVTGAMNLEFDLRSGKRGSRQGSVTERICALTGAPAATVVNNTAAALVLVLNTFALGREVPVSRGELIEIGGSFRLPDIMAQAGARLREVGTTNRTHPQDYEAAISEHTAMLLKVHPSNYAVEGFSRSVGLAELAPVARAHSLPLCEDLGSGALVDLSRFGLPAEPLPGNSLKAGADLVLFSGDKLLGGPQAGFILGDPALIEQLDRNPLKRALRLDKVTLSLLDAVLACYEDPEQLAEAIPILKLFNTTEATLRARGDALHPALAAFVPDGTVTVAESECQVGSGALPSSRLPSLALKLTCRSSARLQQIQSALRRLPTPVIGRLQQEALWLDLRGAAPIEPLVEQLQQAPSA
ncbi:MAG: L-seryl-tRNA(Sec) selenium transferase [Pseudomonadota bacterium]